MNRYVVVRDLSLGEPVYVARDEADAARWLDGVEQELREKGGAVERPNSLWLQTRGDRYTTYRVFRVPSWET